VSLHKQRTHPGPDVDGCFGCKAATLHIAHSSEWAGDKRKEKALERDLDAYARMRAEGLKPEKVDGAAHVEKTATHRADIEMSTSPFVKQMNAEQKTQLVTAVKATA
jgi:hypothetical protein